jgi:toxin secretion/phage lysis holin
MERWDLFYRYIVTALGGTVGFLYGGGTPLLKLLVTFVIIDYITALIATVYVNGWKSLSSKVGFKGIAKKIMIFALVAIASQVDSALGDSHIFRDATIFFYIANELISVLENATKMNMSVPEQLKQAIQMLKGKGEGK